MNNFQSILVFTGDIAFSGTSEQYDVAADFINSVAQQLNTYPTIVVVPGNHDCDFSTMLGARNQVIEELERKPDDASDPSVVEQCIRVQNAFFRFRDLVARNHLNDVSNRLYYEYCIPAGDRTITVDCYNTAWMSQRHEKPGTLVFPVSMVRSAPSSGFVISAFHHPYNWLMPNRARAFRHAVERFSDLVLMGHEHEQDRYMAYQPAVGRPTSYIAGSALQESSDPSSSAFNVIVLDIDRGEQQAQHFTWNGNGYAPSTQIEQWEPIALPVLKTRGIFEIQADFRSWLDDSGIPNVNKVGKKRSFGEIFIYPQLVESLRDVKLRQKRRTIRSENVFRTLREWPVVFITAPPKSGRTAFAKQLFLEYMNADYIPLYIDATESGLRAGEGLPPVVTRQIIKQYGPDAAESIRQSARDNLVVIVDNIDKSKQRTEVLIAAIDRLARFASRVVVIGDDTAGRVTELAPTLGGRGTSRSFALQPLSHGLRERLAQQWFRSDGDDESSNLEESRRLEQVSRTLDTIIGRNYVPAYPVYILAVLQAYEEGSSVDMRASTHGYFYEILIRIALAGGASKVDFNIRLAFLTHMAYEMFEQRKSALLRNELKASFDRYQALYEVGGLEYAALIDVLLARGMLIDDGDAVRFRYPYLYYYFVANHLSRNIAKQGVRAHIERLAVSVDESEAADILLFLAHLSNDPFIITKLVEAADGFYASVKQATLDSPERGAIEADVKLTYVEKATIDARRERAEARDAHIERATDDDDGDTLQVSETRRFRATLSAGLQMIRILGQILKNFPGSLEADTKLVLTRACYSLGLRILTVALEHVSPDRDDLSEAMLDEFRRAYRDVPDDRLKPAVQQFLWLVTILSSYGLVKVVSSAVAAPELEPTYRKALEAQQSTATTLIDVALRLDVASTFPSELLIRVADQVGKHHLPKTVLKLLVLDHFAQISVSRVDRQRVCAKLGIEYQQLKLPSPSK